MAFGRHFNIWSDFRTANVTIGENSNTNALRHDKDMKKKDLCAKAGISPASITKMGKNGHVTTEILLKICTALDCGIEDIMEIVPDSTQS